MKTKDIIVIINHLAQREEIAKVLEKYNYDNKLCHAALPYYESEDLKINLAGKANYEETICVAVMRELKTNDRILALLKSGNYKKSVCDAAMHSYDIIKKKKQDVTKILEENGYNEIFGESLAEYLEKHSGKKAEE